MASEKPESEWFFGRVPGGYESKCPELGITISADEVKRKSDEMTALLCVRSTMIGLRTVEDDILKTGTLNFYAHTSRVTWVKQLRAACPGEAQGLDWETFLERFVNQVIKAERIGEPLVDLANVELAEGNRYLIPGLVSAEETTIWFGDGGSMKSYLALAACATIGTGSADYMGIAPNERRKVGYVDWEWGVQAHRRRIGRIAGERTIPSISYIRCDRPLTYEVARLQRLVHQHGIGFLVLDSIVFGCDGPAEQADTAARYMNAVRQIGVPSLLIAHITKAEEGDKKPFGCYASDTEVLTRRGWQLHQNMTLDDEVACFDMETETLRWQRPSAIHEYEYSGEMVSITGGSMDMLVTPNHRMVVAPAYELPVGNMKPYKNPRTWHIKEAGALSRSPWYVPFATPFEAMGDEEEALPAFATFLGWWLSEGSFNDDAPTLCQVKGELSERMEQTVREMGYDFSVWYGKAKSRPHEQTMMQLRLRKATKFGRWLMSVAGDRSWNKYIPEFVWKWDEPSRRRLFVALMEGDGGWQSETRGTYTTVSPRLADDMQRLAISLGYSAQLRVRPPSKGHYDQRQILIGVRRKITVRQDHNAIGREAYDGKIYCLTVPTGAYLTRRNGYMGIAGNSTFWANSARLTWFVKKAGEYGDLTTVGLFNRKNNDDRNIDPMAFRFAFDDAAKTTVITQASDDQMALEPGIAEKMGMRERIAAVIRLNGPQTIAAIAVDLGVAVQDVSTPIARDERRDPDRRTFTRVMGTDNVYRIALVPTGTEG